MMLTLPMRGLTSAAFLGVLVLFAKPRQNTVLKCAWLGLLALLLVPQAGSVLNGISYVSNRWVWGVHHAGSLYPGAGLPRHNGV